MRGAHAIGHVPVSRVRKEELPLGRQRCPDVLLTIDVLLAPVNDADVACKRTRQLLLRTDPAERCPSRAMAAPRRRRHRRAQEPPFHRFGNTALSTGETKVVRGRIRGDAKPSWFVIPLRKGSSLFSSTSLASVPSSIRSSLVMTPIVRKPEAATQTSNRFISQTSNRSISLHGAPQKEGRRVRNHSKHGGARQEWNRWPFPNHQRTESPR